MKIQYTLEVALACPADSLPDVYLCIVRSQRTIPVEDILGAVKKITAKGAMYQEDFTSQLHRLLAAEVETNGWHSGVHTRAVCGGPRDA